MTTLNDLNGYLDDEAYTVRVGELRALLSASIADTAKPVIDKSMVKRLMVQYGLDKSHESIADTAEPLPVYQLEQLNGSWLDVSRDAYESTEPERRRTLYMRPVAAKRIADTAGAKAQSLFIFETYTGQNGWLEVSADEFERTKHKYENRIRRRPEPAAPPAPSVADAAGVSDLEALLADITAIDAWHRGSPSYEHDANWFKDRVVRLLEERIAKESGNDAL